MTINILPSIPTADLNKEDLVPLMEKTHAVMSEFLKKMSENGELPPNNNVNNIKTD